MLLTVEQCQVFVEQPSKNPLTGRTIKLNGPTYNKILLSCSKIIKPKKEVKKKEVCIYVVGLGCSEVNPEAYKEEAERISSRMKMPVHLLCNQSLKNTLFQIAKTVCYLKPSLKNVFVQEVYTLVKKYIVEDYNVYLIGSSYGGSVVSRVAELFDTTDSNKLIITTFGSIYIPDKILNMNIIHYMYRNDVALKCNKLDYHKDRSDVKWLRPNDYKTPVKPKFSFFGTDEEWQSHNNYDIYKLFKH
jgi:hypothetical protein